ncbi:prephenate dehydratase [Actinophytocola xinjiangensis]|uniref:Prephenate dehydratase n=1 Tax=Actinophytocola xinjiangensis TaxID=485602 RepID=A0A7Z0WHZ8_9PSEU|nr:prephenate dehydratase [Actinophytocola xinjiangensis]OLF07628.1 prephenate dehydratase [Actinophytocola xinjiangensis]
MPSIAYFGPRGTFSEQAALVHAAPTDSLVPMDTVPRALAAVRAGDADLACVPVENSVEGAVSATMDALAVDDPLVAVAEVVLPVRFSVLVRPGVSAEDVRTVASHPHALAQVQGWLARHLPAATQTAATSTAGAAVGVGDGTWDAAITAPVAANHYPLDVLATDVADVDGAMTRFLVLRRPGALPERTGFDRTSLVMIASAERTGVLAELLTELALRGINLSRIESRPQKGRLGRYRFYLDFDGHVAEQRVGDALAALHRRCEHVRFLGSYPKAERASSASAAALGNSDQDYTQANRWVTAVRNGETG